MAASLFHREQQPMASPEGTWRPSLKETRNQSHRLGLRNRPVHTRAWPLERGEPRRERPPLRSHQDDSPEAATGRALGRGGQTWRKRVCGR